MFNRTRRLRKSPISRNMVAETRLSKNMLIYPYFVTKGSGVIQPIESMPGINRFSVDTLIKDVEEGLKIGVNKILLFGVGDEKFEDAHSAHDDHSIIPNAIRELKKAFGDKLYVITDVCLCAYTSHGHCGLIKNDYVDNDSSIPVIAQMALAHAKAGADMVAPSDMMDGRVQAIREMLDNYGFENTPIMSYSTKFASAYYGPFRDAADSAPGKGDRKSYQMDYRNSREAVLEALLDESEGADMVMVKPALAYLDIIKSVKDGCPLPLACYNVSAEYSMVKLAVKAGLVDEKTIVLENMYAFARAGADVIISYHTRDIMTGGWL